LTPTAEDSVLYKSTEPNVIGNRFEVLQKLSPGQRVVFRALDRLTGQIVALKLEPISISDPTLHHEILTYQLLTVDENIALPLVPKLLWTGSQDVDILGTTGSYNIMANELQGITVRDYRDKHFGGKLPIRECFAAAVGMISCVEFLHSFGFIHRSIHSRNFLLPRRLEDLFLGIMYLIDLEKTVRVVAPNGWHIPFSKKPSPANGEDTYEDGRLNYLSLNCHDYVTPTRRDDLEALGYLILFLHLGKLPWSGKPRETVLQMKRTPLSELCKDLPEAFHLYLSYCKSLSFEQTPDYGYLKSLFSSA